MPGRVNYISATFLEDHAAEHTGIVWPKGATVSLPRSVAYGLPKHAVVINGPGVAGSAFTGESYGSLAAMVAATALLAVPNNVWYAPGGLEFISAVSPVNGITPYWKPRGGKQVLYCRAGSIAAPLATIASAGAAQFALPGGNPSIPAGLLLPGVSQLRVEADVYRNNANATSTLAIRLGTNGSAVDGAVLSLSLPATANDGFHFDTGAAIATATTYCAQNWASFNGTSNAGSTADRTTQFNTALANIVSMDMAAGGSASDTFSLLALAVELKG